MSATVALWALLALQVADPVQLVVVAPPAPIIGTATGLSVTARWTDDVAEVRPDWTDRIGPFEVLGIHLASPRTASGRHEQTWTLDLIAFQSGTTTVPALPFRVHLRDGQSLIASTSPVALTVQTVAVDEAGDIKPLKVPPQRWWTTWDAVLAVVAAALALATAGRFRRRRRHVAPAGIQRTPYEPRVALEALERALPTTDAEIDRFYVLACEAVRTFLVARHGIPASYLPTRDLLRALAAQPGLERFASALAPLAAEFDGVKFAAARPPRARAAAVITQLRALMLERPQERAS